jgi:hypothetical protein
MPYSTYKDSKTGNNVQAIEVGHAGILFGIGTHFEEGDYIVQFPVNLEGTQHRAVFSASQFKERFGGRAKTDWKALGWG